MGAKAEALAKQFEAKVQEAAKVMEKLSDAEWKKVTSAEKWPVCVVAHHIAIAMSDIDQMNAKHAQDFATVGKAETLALHKKNAAAAAAMVRGLDDAALARSASALKGMPSMTAEQAVTGILCGHIDEHIGSIKKTVSA